jgi:ketosteroid isomerase-like protein
MRHFYLHERKIPKGFHSLEHIAIDGGCGAAWGSFEGVREDGSPVAVRFADCFTFADGRILTRRSHLC